MHSLRAKEIKDSLNSQAVPKILVLLKKALSGSTIAQVNLPLHLRNLEYLKILNNDKVESSRFGFSILKIR